MNNRTVEIGVGVFVGLVIAALFMQLKKQSYIYADYLYSEELFKGTRFEGIRRFQVVIWGTA